MTCQFDEMYLYEYLDNTLEAADKVRVNNHLSTCSVCRKKISEIKLLFYELEHMDEVEVPNELEAIRMAVINEHFTQKKTAYRTVTTSIKRTKEVLNKTPVVSTLMPTKEKVSNASKVLYKGTKKVISVLPKKEKKPKKSLRKSLGGLL